MIYFYDPIIVKTLETIKDACDCKNILIDLSRIDQAKANVFLYDNVSAAHLLDQELRKKYSSIDAMISFANSIRPSAKQIGNLLSSSEAAISNLTQDYYGILYDAALKKGIVQDLKHFIRTVDG